MPINPGKLLGATLALVAILAIGASANADGPTPAGAWAGPSTSGSVTGLSPSQKKAREKALRKCRRIAVEARRKACLRRVKRRFRQVEEQPAAPPVEVQVRDKYFSPELVEIKRHGVVRWIWGEDNADPHDVTLLKGPRGVSPFDFQTPSSPAVGFTFTRSFKVPGTYRFACSLHHLMRMTVEVKG